MSRVGGILVTSIGQVEVSAGPIVSWVSGLPFDAEGMLVVTTDAPVPTDPFVAGVRVSPTKGVYVIDDTPVPPNGFSNGFSNGFGA